MMEETEAGAELFTILMAEDDPDDRVILEQAFLELETGGELRFVEDGEELMRYLRRSEKYTNPQISPLPAFILLDLNMPRKDGRRALAEIKADPDLRKIPVIIWTTSKELEDKTQSIEAGADFYVTKPERYSDLVNRLRKLVEKYCFQQGLHGE
jgi:CheY-like chemotaxis protein